MAVKTAVTEVMSYLIANVWAGFGFAFINPIVGYLVGVVVGILMTRLDWLGYMLVSDWANTAQGKAFIDAASKLNDALPSLSKAEREALEKAQVDAFRDLIKLGTAP